MCTRKQAIKIILSEKSGNKDALVDKIGHFYDAFIMMGFIREKVSIQKAGVSSSDRIQWEATPMVCRRADFFID